MTACPNCGAEGQAGRFCTECGSPLARACPSCGAAIAGTEKFCAECGSPLQAPEASGADGAPPARETPAAERRVVSVLFADLVGFTAASESRDAEETREFLSRYFDTCRRLIELYGGVVEKFIGDAVMAVWGTPTATEDDAERAVRAALDLVAAVSAVGDEVGAPELQARAGVLTGEAAVNLAAVGEGMVAGDLVNTASRVQAVAQAGTVLVGEATRRATERAVAYEESGSFELKGKADETPLWRALRVVSGVRGQLKSEGLEAPFVGRKRELRQIKDLFHVCAEEKRAQLVSVTGIAGIGKSRLAWEFYKYIDGLADTAYWHRGRCLAYGEGVTYWALADMVRMRCRIAEDDEPEAAAQKLQATLEEHLLDAEERRFVEPRLAQLLGLGGQETRDRQDLFAAWRLFFERLADAYPTVLAFEDMQWADASLLDFVEYLLDWSRNHPLFVVTMARPELLERRPTWGAGHRNFTSLYLEPLSEQAMEELLAGLVPGLPAALRSQILERAEGVPLYAVETVRMLLDRGLLVQDGSVYRVAGEIESLEVPETLHALVAARLDGLAPEERRLLQDAAVIGKTFTSDAVGALSGPERGDLDELLSQLVRREVLSLQSDPRSPEQGQYGFLQDLLRQVAYETLPKRARRDKHLAAAEYLSAALAEDEVAEVIASHLLQAYRLEPGGLDSEPLRRRAHAAVMNAGERAASLGAPTEACRYFEQAAELADTPGDQAGALLRAGELAVRGSAYDRAETVFDQAIALYEGSGDLHAAARASVWRATVDGNRGLRDEAIERMERAYAVIADDEPDADLALLLVRLGQSYWFRGDVEQASERTEQGLDLAEALGRPDLLVRGWNTRGMIIGAHRPEEARGLFQLAFDTARVNEVYPVATALLGQLSDLAFRHDRYLDSLAHLEQLIGLARRLGLRGQEWYANSEVSYALSMLGRWDEALVQLDAIPEEQLEASTQVLSPLTGVLDIHLHRGALDEARRLLARYERLQQSRDLQVSAMYQAGCAAVRQGEGNARGALAAAGLALETRTVQGLTQQGVKHAVMHALEAALRLGDRAKAEELLGAIDEQPAGLQAPLLSATAHRFRARLAGSDAAADSEFTAAATELRELELPFHLAVVQLEHAEWLVAQSRRSDAEPLFTEARETFEALRAKPWLERLDASAEVSEAAVPSA